MAPPSRFAKNSSGRAPRRRRKREPMANLEICIGILVVSLLMIMLAAIVYQFSFLAVSTTPDKNENGGNNARNLDNNDAPALRKVTSHQTQKGPLSHLTPPIPYLPIFAPIPNAEELMSQTLSGQPTLAGIVAILQNFLTKLHRSNVELDAQKAPERVIMNRFFDLAKAHLVPLDAAYRNKSVFPIREDESIFISLAAFREHMLGMTLRNAFSHAKHPDKLYIGAVVQNCFGKVNPETMEIDPSGLPCRTGAQVIGKNAKGRDMTKISDTTPDKNGIEEFCTSPDYKKYCDAGQIRVLYVHESESLGPAMARYYASKLWGGETYFMQTDSHLQFASHWDEKFIVEYKTAKSYPKLVLSSYPPGFTEAEINNTVVESNGARLCVCMTKEEDPNPIIRINTGTPYRGDEPRPTQIPFIAAGFFFTRGEFLIDVPFDPFMPWCFMGEEMALSMRAWTSGWNIYAPRKNYFTHHYRPGRLGLPKFWGSAGRAFHRPLLNNRIQKPVIQRVKHLVGYKSATKEIIKKDGLDVVLTDMDYYGMGKERTWDEFMTFANMKATEDHLLCSLNSWCNQGLLE
eukprot:CAMPEP_0172519120 /NCGR_PEP_ID=MMETSP1066-20121228/291225_1 /TAXON_ID=671091 /ORGANISM="Coscinodiscus wailesii, Strain CCMP2513" /LENGTH=572 /DNA_ID=CAMNT_0013301641 /DNA_START=158 /DNA_END=1876 /DNA_ORIENTATION=+